MRTGVEIVSMRQTLHQETGKRLPRLSASAHTAAQRASRSYARAENQVIRGQESQSLEGGRTGVSHSRILEISTWLLISSSRSWYSGPPKKPWTVGSQEGATSLERVCPEGRRGHHWVSPLSREGSRSVSLWRLLHPLLHGQGPGPGHPEEAQLVPPLITAARVQGGGRGLRQRVCLILQKARLQWGFWDDSSRKCRFRSASNPGPRVRLSRDTRPDAL